MDVQCQYCQVELEASEEFYGTACDCPGCGKKINIPDPNSPNPDQTTQEPPDANPPDAEPSDANPPDAEPSDANPPPPPGTLMKEPCPFCGEKILTTSRRCPFCSKRLEEEDVVVKGGPVSRFLNIFKKK